MKARVHLLIAIGALLFQMIPLVFIRLAAWLTFAPSPWVPESRMWAISMSGLLLCAIVSLTLGILGSYLLLRRARRAVALGLIVLCCVPSLLGAAVYFHALLVFCALV